MHGADTHRAYHHERQAERVRAARRPDDALRLALARDEERRSFLARRWQRRFGPAVAQTSPVTT